MLTNGMSLPGCQVLQLLQRGHMQIAGNVPKQLALPTVLFPATRARRCIEFTRQMASRATGLSNG